MIIALIVSKDANAIPAIFHGDAMDAVLDQLRAVKGAPDMKTEQDARAWLATLPEPSGLFLTEAEARAHLARIRASRSADMTGDDVKSVREKLELSRADFAEAVGVGGNSNTRHKMFWEIENGRKPVSAALASKIRALAAEGQIPA